MKVRSASKSCESRTDPKANVSAFAEGALWKTCKARTFFARRWAVGDITEDGSCPKERIMRRIIGFSLAIAIGLSISASPAASARRARHAPVAKKAKLASRAKAALVVSHETEKLNAIMRFVVENEAQKHGWPANYKALWCPTNVFNLLRRMEQAGVDLSRARVWYIVPQKAVDAVGEASVRPKAARQGLSGPVKEWNFHVVVQIDGRILDLDFMERPEAVPTRAYGAAMWQKGPQAVQAERHPLFVRSIPAADYLKTYSGNWSWFVSGGDGRYPAVEFDSLL